MYTQTQRDNATCLSLVICWDLYVFLFIFGIAMPRHAPEAMIKTNRNNNNYYYIQYRHSTHTETLNHFPKSSSRYKWKISMLASYINIYVLLMTILQRTKVPNININVAQVGPKTPQTCTYTLYIYISIYAEAICKRWVQELSRTRSFREVLEHQLRISPPSFSPYWAGPRKCAMPEIYIKYDYYYCCIWIYELQTQFIYSPPI